ncbi:MAG: 23S rRNA (adenine(1618)-N(6))-methyltransferase RlmF [Bdellovibrionia bacterium]
MNSRARSPLKASSDKSGLHPRNRHRGRYDFGALTRSLPELNQFMIRTPYGDESIDFSNADAVKMLNRAILKSFYGIDHWDIPQGYLCPPVPGRADYIHHIADLLANSNRGEVPTGSQVRVLDIGVGANCIYPIIGHHEYGWSFIGTDIDARALACAKTIADANADLKGALELRLQKTPGKIFEGVIKPGEKIDLSICNPPFHSSAEEARASTQLKWKKLGKDSRAGRNFGGQNAELWCPGGEVEFIGRMIQESKNFSTQCRWFSTLVSKVGKLDDIYRELRNARVADYREQMMSQGQKISRIVAWTFLK